jgi:hypothetical protein
MGRLEYGLGSLATDAEWNGWHCPFIGGFMNVCSIRSIRRALSRTGRMEERFAKSSNFSTSLGLVSYL